MPSSRHLAAALLATCLALCPATGPAWAAPPPRDCPPLGRLPDFKVESTTTRSYDTVELERKSTTGEAETFTVSGSVCTATYHLLPGKDAPSNLEIQANYRTQLEAMGVEIALSGGRNLYAHLVKAGAETWMRVYSEETSIETTVVQVAPPRLTLLPPGPGDYPLIGHMPNFTSAKPVTRNFDSMTFEVDDTSGPKSVTAEGRTFIVSYRMKDDLPELANPEIRYNYAETLRQKGAEILADGGRQVIARLLDKGQVVWVKVYTEGSSVEVSVLEEKPFAPTIKPAELQDALQKVGRVALYVNFDFDKATLRPDATPIVAQILALMKADPALRLRIEGHTDGMGGAEHNRVLSADRARSFAAALVAQGVEAGRLTSAGLGPDKPLASNDTSEGRTRNRRVELVRM